MKILMRWLRSTLFANSAIFVSGSKRVKPEGILLKIKEHSCIKSLQKKNLIGVTFETAQI